MFRRRLRLEDAFYRQGRIYDRADAISSPVATAFATFSNGGVRFPDIVGNIQINQTWGTAFLSAQAAQKFPELLWHDGRYRLAGFQVGLCGDGWLELQAAATWRRRSVLD